MTHYLLSAGLQEMHVYLGFIDLCQYLQMQIPVGNMLLLGMNATAGLFHNLHGMFLSLFLLLASV